MKFRFTVNQNPLSVEFETDSIEEGASVLIAQKSALSEIFANMASLNATAGDDDDDSDDAGGSVEFDAANPPVDWQKMKAPALKDIAATLTGTRPGSKADAVKAIEDVIAAKAAESAAPAPVATAPAPIPMPGQAAPTAPAPQDGLAIPEFLRRDQEAPAAPPAVAAPPPPAAPAPAAVTAPPPPAAPPATSPNAEAVALAEAIVADLQARKEASADGGAALAKWLAESGYVVANATFDEAVAVLRFPTDLATIKPLADILKVSA